MNRSDGMNSLSKPYRRGAFVVCVAFALAGETAKAQIRGVVTDEGGRPLPLVTVRTGFSVSPNDPDPSRMQPNHHTATDLDGWFTVPDSTAEGDTLWFSTRGYADLGRAVAAGDSIAVVMQRTEPGAMGTARTGLVEAPRLILREVNGPELLFPMGAVVGRDLELVVTVAGGHCVEFGPTLARQSDNHVVVAVTEIHVRRGVCTLAFVERDLTIPMRFMKPGLASINVVGRWADIELTVRVRATSRRKRQQHEK